MSANLTLARLNVLFGADDSELREAMQGAADRLQSAGQSMQRAGRTMSTRVTLPLLAIGAATLKVASDFEASMNRVQGLTGATGDELETLSDQAKELGRTTQFSASQAADAMGFLGMAGFETTEILATMPDVLNLAAAAQMDLAETADITSNILTGYGLAVEELGRANDVMIATTTSSNTNLRQLGEAFKMVGPIASNVGLEFEEVAAALGVLGNAGIQGSEAGTALRVGLGRLLNPTSQVADALAGLGITIEDVNPETHTLTEIVGALEGAGASAGDVLAIFGQRGAALAPLISQGAEAIEELRGTLLESGGAAQEMADVQMRGLAGAMKRLKSATEGLMIAVAESGMLETFTGLVERFSALISNLAETNPKLLKLATIAATVVAAVGPLLFIAGTLVTSIGAIVGGVTTLLPLLAAISAPVWLAIGAFTALVTAGVAIVDNWAVIRFEVKRLVDWIKEHLVGGMHTIAQMMTNPVGAITGLFAGMAQEVVGNSIVPDMVDGISEQFKRLGHEMVEVAREKTAQVSEAFREMAETGALAMKNLRQGFVTPEAGGGGGLNPFVGMEQTANRVRESMARMREQQAAIAATTIRWKDALASGVANAVNRIASQVGFIVTNFRGLGDAAKRLGRTILTSVVQALTQAVVKALVLKALLSLTGGPGGFFGSVLVGVRQHGGPVQANRPFLVGEAGPELFVPAAAGNIVANDAFGGGGNIAESFERVMNRLGPPPGPMHPEALAQSDYHRRLISEALQDFTARGGSL